VVFKLVLVLDTVLAVEPGVCFLEMVSILSTAAPGTDQGVKRRQSVKYDATPSNLSRRDLVQGWLRALFQYYPDNLC